MSALTGISQISSITTSAGTPSADGQPPVPQEIPKASEEALDFLDNIDEEDFRFIQFEDELVTTSDTGKDLGEFSVSVVPAKHKGEECLLVHANSHGSIDNVPCGTSVVAYVSYKLETLEQQHHAYVKLENHPLDRKTFIVKQQDGYVVNRVISQGEDIQRSANTFEFEDMKGFISEGSNFLLMRLMIKKPFPENCQFVSFDSDSNLCPATYRGLDKRVQTVDDTELDVVGIERTINSISDLLTTWQSYFLPDGHLTSRVQVGSPVTMRLIRVPAAVEEEEDTEKPTFEKKDIIIEDDQEMYSKFLDRKEELMNEHNVYMRHHPELKALLADFLQFLLLRKPDDVIEFAADYFSSFASGMPPATPYLQSAAPTPYPMSRSNSKIQYLARTKTS